ncbi:hypothetical protein, partial [Vibrio cholerae]|uniref:hypothetical protein n=1 Tax=Vibrio cholerae TaxID=666 RepID=UPI001C106DBE
AFRVMLLLNVMSIPSNGGKKIAKTDGKDVKDGKNAKTNAKDKGRNDLAKKLPKNKKAFEKEVTLLPDT